MRGRTNHATESISRDEVGHIETGLIFEQMHANAAAGYPYFCFLAPSPSIVTSSWWFTRMP